MDRIDEILPYRASWQEDHRGPLFHSGQITNLEESTMSREPRHVMSEKDMDKVIGQMAGEIRKRNADVEEMVLMGIRTRGVPLANWLATKYEELTKEPIKVGILDINLYRDDLSEVDHQPIVKQTELPIPIQGKGVILVDDVLFTGRTIRAAMDAIVDFGRPRFVQLAVLVDRGFRELPIHADFVGRHLDTTIEENVKVMLKETDGENRVIVKYQK
jgi:pyrimidine operon attenuation protein / uracil phosphoribosyltransferase